CRNYFVLAVAATIASWLIAHRFAYSSGRAAVLRAASVFLTACGGIVGIVLLTGTSVNGLLDGLLLTPLKMPGVALLPAKLSDDVLFNAAASLTVAVLVLAKAQDLRARNMVTILKALFSVTGAFCLIGNATPQLAFLLPWVWLVAVPRTEEAKWDARE